MERLTDNELLALHENLIDRREYQLAHECLKEIYRRGIA